MIDFPRITWPYALYITPPAVLVGSIALLYAMEDHSDLRAVSVPIVQAKLARYDMEVSGSPDFGRSRLLMVGDEPRWSCCNFVIIGHYPCGSYFNIASIFLTGALAWSLASFRLGGEELRRRHGDIGCTGGTEGEGGSGDCSACGEL